MTLAHNLRVCRGCGCDDDHACVGPRGERCSWTLLDIDTPTGVCSACAARLQYHPALLATIGFEEGDSALAALGFHDDFSPRRIVAAG